MADTVLPAQVSQCFVQPRSFKGSRKRFIFHRDLYRLLTIGILSAIKAVSHGMYEVALMLIPVAETR